ncbi:uncharacterized protein C4orf19 homolog isoform X2 [Papio anubis]|uniref:uncharacterized protein C4orf19 homolog isoform X2 n=1 Tax=Papio anubis TaxID=9555 RepID=UPI000B7B0AB5|nr:uncharacterized protein C4orf19 homolog isoform X2 [Papio anubis]
MAGRWHGRLCSENNKRVDFLLQCARDGSPGPGDVGRRTPGVRALAPPHPRGVQVKGYACRRGSGHVTRGPNDSAGAAAASSAGSGQRGAASVCRRGRPRPAKPWAPRPRRRRCRHRRPVPGREVKLREKPNRQSPHRW